MVYDRLAERYDGLMAPLERRFLQRWRREALGNLPRDSRILEIGAGTGANFAHYPETARAVASEFAAGMIAHARRRAGRIELVQASVEQLPFASGSFDAAFATLVFCSVADPAKGLSELRRILRPGGTLVLLEHVRPPGILGYVFDVINIFSMALIDDCFNRRTADLAVSAGFKISRLESKASGAVNIIVAGVGE